MLRGWYLLLYISYSTPLSLPYLLLLSIYFFALVIGSVGQRLAFLFYFYMMSSTERHIRYLKLSVVLYVMPILALIALRGSLCMPDVAAVNMLPCCELSYMASVLLLL